MTRFGPLVDVDARASLHERALIYGRVRIGPLASVWPNVANAQAYARDVHRMEDWPAPAAAPAGG